MTPPARPSSNWLGLQKSLVRDARPWKRRKIDRGESTISISDQPPASPPPQPRKRFESGHRNEDVDFETTEVRNGESIATLRRMVVGRTEYMNSQTGPGKYVAIDCEMVGVGIEGNESSLARVSIVDYTGGIILDVFVRQRERVVDYRTQWSGVRRVDLTGSAKSFREVQHTVAELIKDRVLVGHAIYNDLKALLLSHPSPQIRDTQSLAYKYGVVRSRRPALRVLVKQELGIIIQGGEHSSVTDARATMALFRLYRKQWERGFRPYTPAHLKPKSEVDDDFAGEGKGIASNQTSSHSRASQRQSRKREHSEMSGADADEMDHSSTLSPSQVRPSIHHPLILRKRREESSSRSQKGTLSRIPAVTRRINDIKEVGGKAISGKRGNVAANNSISRNKMVGDEKWWKSLGGGKKGNIKL